MRLFLVAICGLALSLGALSCGGGGGGGNQNQQPVAAFTANSNTGIAPQVISFDASGSTDPDGTIASFEWDFDGDGTVDLTRSQPTAQFEYTAGGSFTATLRVVDQQGASDTATRTLTITALTFSDTVIEPGAAGVDAGSVHGITLSGGVPAAVAETPGGLSYFGADLPDGSDWNAPASVLAADVIEPRVFAVEGRPAVMFIDPGTRSLMYTRAEDGAGSAWPAPLVVAADVTSLEIGFTPDIEPLIVTGRPAVFLGIFDGAVNRVLYLRADDALGGGWATPAVELLPAEDERNPRPVIANGRPALFVDLDGGYHFLRAEDADGTSWPATAVVAELDRSDRDGTDGVAVLDGRPALAYAGFEGLKLIQANDTEGTAFTVQQLLPESADLEDVRLSFLGTRAVLSAVTDSDEVILLVSTSPSATEFAGPIATGANLVTADQFLVEADGSPGVIYTTQTGLLRFLRISN